MRAGFATSIEPGWGWGAGKDNVVEGRTDTNGLCVLTGDGNGGSVGISAHQDGYYWSSGYIMQFTNLVGVADKKWQPWNPTVEVVLKPIGNPIPMYVKRVWEKTVPTNELSGGFDLMVGDWVDRTEKGKRWT